MKRFSNFLVILACFTGLALIASCSKPGQNTTPISIGIIDWPGYDPFILAEKTNSFEKYNVNVTIREFSSTTGVVQAIKQGEIQGAALTLDEVFLLDESGVKGKVVLILDYSSGGDMLIAQKEFDEVKELEGKTIGYEGSVVGEFLLSRALSENRMKARSFQLVDVQKENWLSAFKEKKVDALVCFDPIAAVLLNEYEGNLLFSSAEIPFEIIDVLFFTESFYDDNKAAITSVLRAWFDTLNYLNTNPDSAIEAIASFRNTTVKKYIQTLQGLDIPDLAQSKAIMDRKSDKNIYKYAQVVVDFMLLRGMLSGRINSTDLFQPEIVSGL